MSMILHLLNTTSHVAVRDLGFNFGIFDGPQLHFIDQFRRVSSASLVHDTKNPLQYNTNNCFDMQVFGCVCVKIKKNTVIAKLVFHN